jgi:hypothetical protein
MISTGTAVTVAVLCLVAGGILGYAAAWIHFAVMVDRNPDQAITKLVRTRIRQLDQCNTVIASDGHDAIAVCVLIEGHGGPHATTLAQLSATGFTRPEF